MGGSDCGQGGVGVQPSESREDLQSSSMLAGQLGPADMVQGQVTMVGGRYAPYPRR